MGENRLMADLYEENQRLKERIKALEEKHFSECGQIAHYSDELQKADVQSVKWISVKDRLPSENTLVLCYARSTTGEGNSYFLGAIAHGEFWFLKVNDIGHVSCPVLHWEVTHWQPLSDPPKDGEQNDI